MNDPLFFMILMLIISTAIMAAVLVVVLRNRRRAWQLAMGEAGSDGIPGSDRGGFPRNGTGETDATTYHYHFHPGSKNSPSSYTVKVAHPSTVTFRIAKESGFDRFAEKLGLNVELKTGDPDFDETFYITSRDTEYMRTVLGSAATRQVIRELREIGFTSVELTTRDLKAVWSPFRHKSDMDRPTLERVAGLLVRLHHDLPEVLYAAGIEDSGWRARRLLAFALPIAADIAGPLALVFGLIRYYPFEGWPLALGGLALGVPVLIVFLYAAFHLLKGRSASHREFFVAALLAVPGFLLGGAGGRIFTNGWLDSSPAVEHEVRVVDAHMTTSDDDEDYYAIVSSWREGRETEKIPVTEGIYRRLSPGLTAMTVTTRSGKWGYEWLAGCAVR